MKIAHDLLRLARGEEARRAQLHGLSEIMAAYKQLIATDRAIGNAKLTIYGPRATVSDILS